MKQTRNELLKRKEVTLVMNSDANPGFDKARAEIASQMKVSEDVIAVKNVKSNFGRREFVVDALVYDSVEDKNRIEPKAKAPKKAPGAM